jgi:hypothetical protein
LTSWVVTPRAVLMCALWHPLSYTMYTITAMKNILQGDKNEALRNGRNCDQMF